MKTQICCDFDIVVEIGANNTILKSHKFILKSRSPYFYNLINHSTKQLVIKNFDINLIKNIVDYIYLTDCTFLEEIKNLDLLLDILKISK